VPLACEQMVPHQEEVLGFGEAAAKTAQVCFWLRLIFSGASY